MKNILKTISILLFFFFSSCYSQKNSDNSNLTISYKAQTRGAFFYIDLKNNVLNIESKERKKSIILNKTQLDSLRKEVLKIELSKIEKLKAPSEKRFTDGAMIANFAIEIDENRYVSLDFDHENPPKELKSLYLYLLSFVE